MSPEGYGSNFESVILQHILIIDTLNISGEITQFNTIGLHIGLGNGLVPSGTNPSPEPMLTEIDVTICCH